MKNKISIGNAGEYFAAGELERRGFSVAVPMSNVELFDILAIDRITHKQFAIQVKTTEKGRPEWPLSYKNESIIGDNIFYIFIVLYKSGIKEFYIVPSKVVARKVKNVHKKWLNTPGKNGQKHNDSNLRVYIDKKKQYLDRWDLLK